MFDVTAFLASNFGDADGVLGLTAKHCGRVPQRDTARKWFERGSVSSDWLPELLYALEMETGTPVSLADYMKGATDDVFA